MTVASKINQYQYNQNLGEQVINNLILEENPKIHFQEKLSKGEQTIVEQIVSTDEIDVLKRELAYIIQELLRVKKRAEEKDDKLNSLTSQLSDFAQGLSNPTCCGDETIENNLGAIVQKPFALPHNFYCRRKFAPGPLFPSGLHLPLPVPL